MDRIESITVAPTSERRTEPGRFAQALRGAAQGLATGFAAGVELAAPFVPGGTVLTAAVRLTAATAATATRAVTSEAAPREAGVERDAVAATRTLQEQSQSFSLQYLQLQEALQRENREFAALSSVMKVKHDSAHAAIDNIR